MILLMYQKKWPNMCCLMSGEWTQGLAEMGFDANWCASQKFALGVT